MTSTQLAWAAGLFEGEGCMSGRNTLRLQMTDKDVVEKFHDAVGLGKIYYYPSRDGKRKETWTWYLEKRNFVRLLLSKFLPYFGNRRAHKALDILDTLEC